LSQVQGISIEGFVQFEKIVTDIYKMLQQISSKGMVKGIWFFLLLFNFKMLDRFPDSEISDSVDSL
jgi:hypothetical protein